MTRINADFFTEGNEGNKGVFNREWMRMNAKRLNRRTQRQQRDANEFLTSVLYVLAHSMLVVVLFIEHAEACASALMPWTVWPLRLETGVGLIPGAGCP